MKKGRFIKFAVLPILAVIIITLYKYYSPSTVKLLAPIHHQPITLEEDEKIHFFKEGFAISGAFTQFYDLDGIPMTSPFSDETASNKQLKINMSTPNYMLVDGKLIYRTSTTPFEKVYELDASTGSGIQEFSDYLVILIEDESNILIPKLFDLNQNVLLNIKDIDSLYYMDSDYDPENNSLSILALSLEASFPSSKVFNYINGGTTLYSVISSANEAYYKILRLPSHIILVGTHEMLCYNIDGTLQWSIKNKEIKNYTVLETDNGFIFYFSYPIDNSGDGIFFNALAINSDGSFKKLDYPRDLVDLQPYGNNLIGLRYGRNVVILDKNGSIKDEFYVSEDIVSLYYNKYHEHNLYLLDRDNQLHIYSIKEEDSRE